MNTIVVGQLVTRQLELDSCACSGRTMKISEQKEKSHAWKTLITKVLAKVPNTEYTVTLAALAVSGMLSASISPKVRGVI